MAGAIDRYFQLARCYRDEDLRGNKKTQMKLKEKKRKEKNADFFSQLIVSLSLLNWISRCLSSRPSTSTNLLKVSWNESGKKWKAYVVEKKKKKKENKK